MLEFSPYAYEFHEDPYPLYQRLREEAPVYHNREADFWALSRHRDVLAAFKDPKRFSNKYGVSIDPSAVGPNARTGTSFLAMDPPEHTKFRGRVARGFTPRRVAEMEPWIREISVRYLDGLKGKGSFDLISDFAGKLPMDVISKTLGVPSKDRAQLRTWADMLVHRVDGLHDLPPEGIEAFGQIRKYLTEHLARLRSEPGDDLLSSLLAQKDPIPNGELLGFSNLMIVAGNETTTKLLGNALYWLWRNPRQRALLRSDLSLIPQWIDETLRYDNSTQALMRWTQEDVEIDGITIPKDSKVLLLVGSANRDPEAFENPDAYDICRDTSDMLSFGRGTHFCMGASLARLEARVAFEEWWKRFPDYEIKPEGIVRVHSVNVRGFAALPIKV